MSDTLNKLMLDALKRGMTNGTAKLSSSGTLDGSEFSQKENKMYVIRNLQHLEKDARLTLLRLVCKYAGPTAIGEYNDGCLVDLDSISPELLAKMRMIVSYYISK